MVSNYSGSQLIEVANNRTIIPGVGNVITIEYIPDDGMGHAAIISAVNIDSAGNGTITVVEQNVSAGGTRDFSVANKVITGGVTGWLHDPQHVSSPSFSSDPKADILWYESWGGGTAKMIKTNITGTGVESLSTWLTGFGAPTWAWAG